MGSSGLGNLAAGGGWHAINPPLVGLHPTGADTASNKRGQQGAGLQGCHAASLLSLDLLSTSLACLLPLQAWTATPSHAKQPSPCPWTAPSC